VLCRSNRLSESSQGSLQAADSVRWKRRIRSIQTLSVVVILSFSEFQVPSPWFPNDGYNGIKLAYGSESVLRLVRFPLTLTLLRFAQQRLANSSQSRAKPQSSSYSTSSILPSPPKSTISSNPPTHYSKT
jgi:hypothetical protein